MKVAGGTDNPQVEADFTPPNATIIESKHEQKIHSLLNLPNTINGVALGSAGTAVMLRNVGHMYAVTDIVKWPFFLFLFWAAVLMLIYLVKVSLFCTDTLKTDFKNPLTIARSGVYCMSLFLIGSALSSDLVGFPVIVAQVIVVTGQGFQFAAMSLFFYVCYRTGTLPEPFFNAGALSIIFPAITLPGTGSHKNPVCCISASFKRFSYQLRH